MNMHVRQHSLPNLGERRTAEAGVVDIWMMPSTASVPIAGQRSHSTRMRPVVLARAAAQSLSVARGAALKTVLSLYSRSGPSEVQLARADCLWCGEPHGKPVLASGAAVEFSCSSSDEWIAIAVSRSRVGIDIERLPEACEVSDLASALHPEERSDLRSSDQPAERFAEVWTRKESILKGSGLGLRAGTASFACVTDGDLYFAGSRWSVSGLDAPEGYRAAVAVQSGCVWPRP